MKRLLISLSGLIAGVMSAVHASDCSLANTERPNLIYILTDDQGYGDVSALNPDSKIPTPHIDRLAEEGMIFTDAHSSSSVCTPTRYQVLTGRYSWRTTLKSSVLDGYGKPLIAEDRLTWASLLQDQGYQTAMIGKWHLGMDLPAEKHVTEKEMKNGKIRQFTTYEVDWSQPIGRTPTSNGFDYFWGHGASLDFPPYVYIENDRYTSQTVAGKSNRDFGFKSTFRPGPVADNFNPWTTLDEFRDRSAAYIRNWDGAKPFALYVPLTSPHTPIIPTNEWQGKSGLGDYGDFVMQTDAVVGAILDAVDARGIADNTIIVFTADNGCSGAAKPEELAALGHDVSRGYRGLKGQIYEGGHRVPHILRWPAKVEAGSTTDRLTVLGDIVATMADITGAELPDNAAEDSLSFYPALLGQVDTAKEHSAIINHSFRGAFAVRTPEWKLVFPLRKPAGKRPSTKGFELYDMVNDSGETTNVFDQHPEVVQQLTQLGTQIVVNGRSTPGAPQPNDTPNDWAQIHWIQNESK